jgi:hypothetical protein
MLIFLSNQEKILYEVFGQGKVIFSNTSKLFFLFLLAFSAVHLFMNDKIERNPIHSA